MKKQTSKLLSMLLCFMMILGLMPMTVFAETGIISKIDIEGLKYPVLTKVPVSLEDVECWACRKESEYSYPQVEKLDVTDLKWECTKDYGATWSYTYDDGPSVSTTPIRYGYRYRVSFTVHPKETACGDTLAPLVGDKVKEDKEPHTIFGTSGFSSYNSSFVYKWAECIDNGDGSFTFRSYHYAEECEIKDIASSLQNYLLGETAESVTATTSTAGVNVNKVEIVTIAGSEETKVAGALEANKDYWAKVSFSIVGDNQNIYEFTDYNFLKDYHGIDSERYKEYREAVKLNGIEAEDIVQAKNSGFSDDYNITAYFKLPQLRDAETEITSVDFTLDGYELGKKAGEASLIINTANVLFDGIGEYDESYIIEYDLDGDKMIDGYLDVNDVFEAGVDYYLGVAIKSADGFNFNDIKKANMKLNGIEAEYFGLRNQMKAADIYFNLPQLQDGHTHTANGSWQNNSTDHWKVCDCGTILDKAAHDYGDDNVCDTCGYTNTTGGDSKEPSKPANTKPTQTGDNSNIFIWIALMFVSGFGIFGAILYSRKKKECVR